MCRQPFASTSFKRELFQGYPSTGTRDELAITRLANDVSVENAKEIDQLFQTTSLSGGLGTRLIRGRFPRPVPVHLVTDLGMVFTEIRVLPCHQSPRFNP